jgi:hypothetical protein
LHVLIVGEPSPLLRHPGLGLTQSGQTERCQSDPQKGARISHDGADASRRVIVLRIPIRFLSGASRLAIKRLQRTSVPASKLACPSAADPQHVLTGGVPSVTHAFCFSK